MKLSDLIPYIGKGQEEETLNLIKNHVETTYHVVEELRKAVKIAKVQDNKKLKEKIDEISSLESEADKLRRQIEENMYSGAFLPVSRSRILDLAENVDDIADTAQGAAKLLIYLDMKKIDREITNLMDEELEYGLRCLNLLKKAIINMNDTESVKLLIEEIREAEHTSDTRESRALAALYSKKHDPNTTLLLHNLIKSMGDLSDRAEDASDSLSLIVIMQTP